MTAVLHPPLPAKVKLDVRIMAGLAVAATIAWIAPFDVIFGALTLGNPVLRAGSVVTLALAGLVLAGRLGLRVEPVAGQTRPILVPVFVAVALALACAGVDLVFRPVLHPAYLQVMTRTPLAWRMLGFILRAFNENILYQLFLGPALAWSLGLAWRDRSGRPHASVLWIGFAAAQILNIWANVTSQGPLSTLGVVHDLLRFVAPGMMKAWLFWRRGFQADEIASTSVHLFFQPLAGLWLGG